MPWRHTHALDGAVPLVPVYRLSGRIGAALFFVPLYGLVTAALLSVPYTYARVHMPFFGVTTFLLIAVYGAAIALAIRYAARNYHCRNRTYVYSWGLVSALFGFYIQWPVFAFVLAGKLDDPIPASVVFQMAMSPSSVWTFLTALAETGWYALESGSRYAVSGAALWAIWTLYLGTLIVVVPAITTALGAGVYCEHCRRWCRSEDNRIQLRITDDVDAMARIQLGDLGVLERLEPARPAESPRLRLVVNWCDICHNTVVFQLMRVDKVKARDGSVTEIDQQCTPRYLVGADGLERIERMAVLARGATDRHVDRGSRHDRA